VVLTFQGRIPATSGYFVCEPNEDNYIWKKETIPDFLTTG
jgi:hypothetical protein